MPRTKLPAVLAEIHRISADYRVKVCNVFHAGDGNLHPNIGYDASDPEESARVHAAMGDIMHACIEAGGTITGEHGVGLDKLPYMDALFNETTLSAKVLTLEPGADTPRTVKLIGFVSLVSWLAVLYCGRMLPFLGDAF